MAQLIDNVITYGASGAFGKQFVFSRRNGKVFICKMPRRYEGPPTGDQLKNRERFAFANNYAKAAIADAGTKALYQAAAKPGQSAYNRAFSDAFHSPEVTDIKLEAGVLRIKAKDDLRVVSVKVRILNEQGFEEETGEASPCGGSLYWEYRLRGRPDGKEKEVIAEAYDLAGNTGRNKRYCIPAEFREIHTPIQVNSFKRMEHHAIKVGGQLFCEPSCYLLEEDTLYTGMERTRNGIHVNEDPDAEFTAIDIPSKEVIWTYKFDVSKRKAEKATPVNRVTSPPVAWNDRLIVISAFELACLFKKDGKKIWSVKFKEPSDGKISIVDQQLYLTSMREIHRIDIETGKSMLKKKYRVKWFDSPVITYRSRYFAATASSKIIELDPGTLDVLNEYTWPGGWAMAETPFFHEDLMVSGNYGAYIMAFNLNSSQQEWKIKKATGARPLQTYGYGSGLFYNMNADSELRCIDIGRKKTLWSSELERVQAIRIINGQEFLAVYKSAENTYNLGLFDFHTGGLKQRLTDEPPVWGDYKYDLWESISIGENGQYIVSNFKPNEITVLKKA